MEDVLARLLLEGKTCDNCLHKGILMHREGECELTDQPFPEENICGSWEEYDYDKIYRKYVSTIDVKDMEAIYSDFGKIIEDFKDIFK